MASPSGSTVQAREMRSFLPVTRRQRSYVVSLTLFAVSASAYLVTFVFAYWPDLLVLNLASSVANGLVIGLLFIIGHDACHGSFTPSAPLNRALARAAFLTSLQPYASWVYTHNGLHHAWTNLKGKDVVFAPFSLAEYKALAWQRRLLERLYRTPWGLGLMHLTQVWWKHELFPAPHHAQKIKGTFLFDRLLVLGFLLAKIGMGVWLSFLVSGDLGYSIFRAFALLFITYVVWFWLIGFVTFQQHTHPDVPWYDKLEEWNFFRGQIHGTPHILFPRWFHKLLHNVMDHNAHHVDPLIPMYHLPASQRSLEHAYGDDLVTSTWSLRGYFHSCKVCRLYDYDHHQWLNYDGVSTSRAGLNQLSMTTPIKLAA